MWLCDLCTVVCCGCVSKRELFDLSLISKQTHAVVRVKEVEEEEI